MDTTGVGRGCNRSWPEAVKREIVAASFAPDASVSVIARRYDVNANQVFRWRKLYRNGSDAPADPFTPLLVPLIIAAAEERGDVAPGAIALPEPSASPSPTAPAAKPLIELQFGGGVRLRIFGAVDPDLAAAVVKALPRR